MPPYQNPTIADFQAQFLRDFPYNSDPNYGVTNTDIEYAFNLVTGGGQPTMLLNPALFPTQTMYTIGFNLLAAHFLVLNLRAASQGINGQYNWIQQTKSVNAVSEGFQIPERIAANPTLVMLTKTNYGAQLLQLVLSQLNGAMFVAPGGIVGSEGQGFGYGNGIGGGVRNGGMF